MDSLKSTDIAGTNIYHRITADDLYDDAGAMIDEFEEEESPYVDMFDVNLPSAEWMAREEERHRLEVAGVQRLSNEAFGNLRFQARYGARLLFHCIATRFFSVCTHRRIS